MLQTLVQCPLYVMRVAITQCQLLDWQYRFHSNFGTTQLEANQYEGLAQTISVLCSKYVVIQPGSLRHALMVFQDM